MTTDLSKGHRQRLRDRYKAGGPEAMPEYEILELLLMQAIPRRDVKPLAKELISHFGSLSGVLSAPVEKLENFKGLGEGSAFALTLSYGVAQKIRKEKLKKQKFSSKLDIIDYLYSKLADLNHEEFFVMYLDSKNGLIKDESLFRGTVNRSTVYPREVMKQAITFGATKLIVAHNHPSGDVTPSIEDEMLTVQLFGAAKTMGIHLIDHLIIGKEGHYSFEDEGKL